MRPHPRRGAVTRMFPGRSPGSRNIDQKKKTDSATNSRLPVLSTVALCESSSRLQWRYRSGFSPLSLSVSNQQKRFKTPRNYTYLIDDSRLIARNLAVNINQFLYTEHLRTPVSLRRHLDAVLKFTSEQALRHRTVNCTNNVLV